MAGRRAHGREQDHFPDVGCSRQEHDQAVDADTQPAGAGQSVFQGPHVVLVDVAGLRITLCLGPVFGLEGGQLSDWVVLLAVGVAQLKTGHHQLEALDVTWAGAVRSGQRRDLGRVVQTEDRFVDVVLDPLVHNLFHQFPGAPLGVPGDAEAVQHLPGLADRHGRVHADAQAGPDQLVHGDPRPGRRQIDRSPGNRYYEVVAQCGPGRVHDEPLDQIHHVAVVGEGLVCLEHGELGVVAHIDTLIAKHPGHLEHPLHPADDEPFEMQLQRDTQVHIDVERIVMGDEGAGGGAALDGLQHRAFYFPKALLPQMVADRVDDGPSDTEDLPGALVDH